MSGVSSWPKVPPDTALERELRTANQALLVSSIHQHELTEQAREAEQALRASEAHLRQIADSMPQIVWTARADGYIDYYNERWYEFSGFPRDRFGQGSWEPILHHDDVAPSVKTYFDCIKTGKPFEVECRFRDRATGGFRWFICRALPIRGERGQVLKWFGTCTDIDAQKRAEQALRESEERYRLLFEMGPVAIYSIDASGMIQTYNRQAAKLWGREPALNDTSERFCGSFKLIRPDGSFMPHHECPMGAVVSGKIPEARDAEVLIERPDGSRATVIVNIRPLKNERGETTGAINCFYDITERKAAEDALRRSEEGLERELAATQQLQAVSALLIQGGDTHALYQKIVEAAVAIMRSDFASMQMVDERENALRLLAFQGFDAEFRQAFELCRPDTRTACSAAWRTGERVIVPDVETREFLVGTPAIESHRQYGIRAVQSTPLFSRGGRLLGIISTHWRRPHTPQDDELRRFDILARQAADLIERKAGEEATARLAAIVMSSDDAIISKDLSGVIVTWNQGAQRLFGYTAEEVIGRPVSLLIPKDRQNEEPQILERVRRGESIEHYETVRQRKDGTHVDISLGVSPLRDAAGKVIGASKVARDISQLKRTAEALQLADHRKDEFLAMLAHELRNPMAAISNAIHLSRTPELGERDLAWAREMLDRQMDQLGRLVDDLLDVARITHGRIELKRELLPVTALVRRAVESLGPRFEVARLQLSVKNSREPLWVEWDGTRLEQVLVNLLSNAVKYTPAGGQVWLQTAGDGGDAVITVRDTGIGISREMLPKVFDMFAQAEQGLARSQGGLGIGLALVRRLVEIHGGSISAESPGPGQGSTFTVRLPLAQPRAENAAPSPRREKAGAAAPAAAGPTVPPAERQPLRVLVVDDNRDAAQTLARLLNISGHQTQIAFTGAEALEAADIMQPQLALLDIGLPEMDGYELARRLKQVHPAIFLAAISGYGQAADRQRAKEAGFDEHFVKPVKLEALLRLFDQRQIAAGV